VGKQFLKGMCYAPFPVGYNPSKANDTCIFFGSDIASYNMKPLWGDSFSTKSNPDKVYIGRNDIKNLSSLGVNLIRLYDWDSRNNHIPFLDYCHEHGVQVLVPVSNYNLGAFGPAPDMTASITGLINSFTKARDYHPAIYGITIGSETDNSANIPKDYLIQYTNKWVEIESIAYRDYRKVMIGHPISFGVLGPNWYDKYPCFGYLDKLIPSLIRNTTRDLNKRLMLCPHTYNEASYLYRNAEESKKGWVDLAYERYHLPILFCEIGCSRMTRTDYLDVITSQIEESMVYHIDNPDKLLGLCYFQYCDKVWMNRKSEGSYGIVANTKKVTDIVEYDQRDFDHWIGVNCNNTLNIQELSKHPAYKLIGKLYG
jgi:hypothetical protein